MLKARAVATEITSFQECFLTHEEAVPYVDYLGGPNEAARKLSLFLRFPEWAGGSNGNGWGAVVLLANCGNAALPTLEAMLSSCDERTQSLGAIGLVAFCFYRRWPDARPPAVVSSFTQTLKAATKDEDPRIRALAEKALKVWKDRGWP